MYVPSRKKSTLSCYFENYPVLRLDYEDKFETNWKKIERNQSSSWDVWIIQKKLHHYAISEIIDFWELIMKTKVV